MLSLNCPRNAWTEDTNLEQRQILRVTWWLQVQLDCNSTALRPIDQ